MKTLNLTQHAGTTEQEVIEPSAKAEIQKLLTFEELPTLKLLLERAEAIAEIASAEGAEAAMIGGAPFFMAPLEAALRRHKIVPLYAFSHREVVEETLPDGAVRKTTVFRHLDYVEAATTWWDQGYYNSGYGLDEPYLVLGVPPK